MYCAEEIFNSHYVLHYCYLIIWNMYTEE